MLINKVGVVIRIRRCCPNDCELCHWLGFARMSINPVARLCTVQGGRLKCSRMGQLPYGTCPSVNTYR